MNTKKIAWRTAAVAAAALFSAGAHADLRRESACYQHGRNSGDRHQRVWNDRMRGHFELLASLNK